MRSLRMPVSPGFIPAIVLLALSAVLLWLSQDFGRSSGLFPRFIGSLFVALSLMEVIVQIARSVKQPDRSFAVDPDLIKRPIMGLSWIVGFIVAVYLIGFVVAVPLFIFAFLRFSGRHSWALSTSISAGSLLFIYLIFILLLNYDLFPGILMPD